MLRLLADILIDIYAALVDQKEGGERGSGVRHLGNFEDKGGKKFQ